MRVSAMASLLASFVGASRWAHVGRVEVAGLCGVALFLLVLVWGRHNNARVARAVDAGLARGVGGEYVLEGRLVADRQTRREGWWSGRRHVVGFHAVLELVPRQDVLKWVVGWVMPRRDDVVTLDVFLRDGGAVPCVAALYGRRRVKAVRRELFDLATFCAERGVTPSTDDSWPPEGAVFFGEPGAALQDLLGARSAFVAALAAAGGAVPRVYLKLLRCVHVTDQNGVQGDAGEGGEDALRGLRGVPAGSRCVVRVEAILPRRVGEVETFVESLASAAHALADAVATYRMDPGEAAARRKARAAVEEQRKRAEQKRRAAAIHREKQNKMTAEEARRQAKRKQDRKLRKGAKQVKIM